MPEDASEAWPAGPASPSLAIGEVHVWRSPLRPDTARERSLSPLLSDTERARAARFRFDHDAQRYAIARGLLRVLLARYCGTSPATLALEETEHGRPLLRSAAAPSDFDFNLSHAENLVVYAFARGARVGVDVEWITPLDDMNGLVAMNFSERERHAWQSLPATSRERGFFDCWTRKEAFVKAIGEGLSHPLDAFDVSFSPDEAPRFLRIGGDDAERWSLHALETEPGYACALAVEAASVTLRCWSYPDDD